MIKNLMRLSSILQREDLIKIIGGIELNASLVRSYNIHTGESVSILTSVKGTLERSTWGFRRSGNRTVDIPVVEQTNVHTKPSFRMSFRNRRCLILVDSFYLQDQDKIPYRFFPAKDSFLMIPGVYDYDETSKEFNCCAIVRKSRHSIEKFSAVEPVCIEYSRWSEWIAEEKEENLIEILHRTSLQPLEKYRVSNKLLIRGFNKAVLHQPTTIMPSLF